MKKIILLLLITASLFSCRKLDNFGFYQPITMQLTVPDGPPEYKAGWYAGCKASLGQKTFSNSWIYQEKAGASFGVGVYQHDPNYQTAWGQGWFCCVLHAGTFVTFNSMRHGPLQ